MVWMVEINNCEQNKFLPRVAGVTLTLIVITSSPHCGGYSKKVLAKPSAYAEGFCSWGLTTPIPLLIYELKKIRFFPV